MIVKDKLLQLIEQHLEKDLVENLYEVVNIQANKLLTHTRFDLAFKLLYLEMMGKDINFAKEIYKEHIRAFSLGQFTEPGNENKNTINKFIIEFNKTFEDIKNNGFDSDKSIIPLSKNGSIANGAHRVASAIYLNKDIKCVKISSDDHRYDYDFFYKRNVSSEIMDIAATKFVEYANNIYIAFIWPIAQGHDKEIEGAIPNVVYKKEMKLTPNGAHNLISQIYYGEEWLGDVEDDFRGSKGKLVECFKSFEPVRVIAFQANSLNEVLKIKDDVRNIFNVGKHSIHITDTKEEAIRIARIVFNDNSIHFLNYAKPNRYISTHKKIDKFKKFLQTNEMSFDDVLLDSSIVLSTYGLREAKDTDFFCFNNSKIINKFKDINIHDEELQYYQEEKNELIYNPKNYFYFNDLKFVSLSQLYKMKKNRNEEKDKNDCKLMEALIKNDWVKKLTNKWRQNFYYGKIRARASIVKFLKDFGLFEIVKKIVKGSK